MSVNTINNKLETGWNPGIPAASPMQMIDYSIQAIAQQAFDNFSKAWSYIGKTLIVTRQILNTIIRTPAWIASGYFETEKNIRNAITKLKLFSIVGVILDTNALPSKINAIWTNIKWKDSEGALLSTLTLTLMVTDMFDSVTTFVNATLEIMSKNTLAWVSVISLPLTLFMITLSTTLKTGNLYNLTQFSKEFDKEVVEKVQGKHAVVEEVRAHLEQFLQKHLGSNRDPEDAIHRSEITKRHISSKITAELSKLAKLLDSNEPDVAVKISKMVAQIKESLKNEMTLQAGSLLATVIAGVAATLFLIPTSGAVPFALLTISFSLRIGMQAYQDWKINNNSKFH